eukprot:COSAG06_NODE_21801_length_744_cov_12.082171_1_plen_178_part_10
MHVSCVLPALSFSATACCRLAAAAPRSSPASSLCPSAVVIRRICACALVLAPPEHRRCLSLSSAAVSIPPRLLRKHRIRCSTPYVCTCSYGLTVLPTPGPNCATIAHHLCACARSLVCLRPALGGSSCQLPVSLAASRRASAGRTTADCCGGALRNNTMKQKRVHSSLSSSLQTSSTR